MEVASCGGIKRAQVVKYSRVAPSSHGGRWFHKGGWFFVFFGGEVDPCKCVMFVCFKLVVVFVDKLSHRSVWVFGMENGFLTSMALTRLTKWVSMYLLASSVLAWW